MSKKHRGRINVSTVIRYFYSPDSSMAVVYNGWHLSFRFYRYSGMDNRGFSKYDLKNGMIATVDYEYASCLYQVLMFILNDKNSEKGINIVFERNNFTLFFEYKPDENKQMAAYFTIEKNDQSISFEFNTCTVLVIENGESIPKVFQSDIGAFAKLIERYLTGIGANVHLIKLPGNCKIIKK
jgi:hypothetical protein